MEIILSVLSHELDDNELKHAARRLEQTLRDEAGVEVHPLADEDKPGIKGVEWTQIVMTLIGSGGVVVTAIKVLGDYVKKNRKIKVKVKTPNGEITIDIENADSDKLVALLQPLLMSAVEAKQLPINSTEPKQLAK